MHEKMFLKETLKNANSMLHYLAKQFGVSILANKLGSNCTWWHRSALALHWLKGIFSSHALWLPVCTKGSTGVRTFVVRCTTGGCTQRVQKSTPWVLTLTGVARCSIGGGTRPLVQRGCKTGVWGLALTKVVGALTKGCTGPMTLSNG
jgi:hypothetical protein